MREEKTFLVLAILILILLAYGQTTKQGPQAPDGWHRKVNAEKLGCGTCHQSGPVIYRS